MPLGCLDIWKTGRKGRTWQTLAALTLYTMESTSTETSQSVSTYLEALWVTMTLDAVLLGALEKGFVAAQVLTEVGNLSLSQRQEF